MHRRRRPRALLFGDSITQFGECVWNDDAKDTFREVHAGYVSILRNRYARRFDVLNRGFSGYNAKMGLAVAKRVFLIDERSDTPDERFVFVGIFFGANDAAFPDRNVQGTSVEAYSKRIREILRLASRVTDHVVLITPPPVDDDVRTERSNERVRLFAQACVKEAALAGPKCDIVNLYKMMYRDDAEDSSDSSKTESDTSGTKVPHYKTCLRDGLHLNGVGNVVVAKAIIECIDARHRRDILASKPRKDDEHSVAESRTTSNVFWETILGDETSSVPVDFPLWRDMSADDPASDANVAALSYKCTNRRKRA